MVKKYKPRKRPTRTYPKKKVMTKSEVAKIAKASVKQMAEAKYFATAPFTPKSPSPVTSLDVENVSVLAYSTTINTDPDGAVQVYGGSQIHEMYCARPFRIDDQDTERRTYALDGKFCQPIKCQSRWLMNRVYGKIDPARDSAANTPDFPPALAANLPVVCRMLRITPKIVAGTATLINPNTDLFLNDYGEMTGVEAEGFQQTELLNYGVNRRRYHVLDDKVFDMRNPLTLSYTMTSENGATGEGSLRYQPIITNTNGNCSKQFRINHQLTQRKNGRLYYEDPLSEVATDNDNPTTGNRREYILFHFSYRGYPQLVGTNAAGGQLRAPVDIVVENTTISKFIDI